MDYDFFAPSTARTVPPAAPAAPTGQVTDDERALLLGAQFRSSQAMGTPVGYGIGRRLGFWDSVRAGAQLAGTCGRVVVAEPWILAVSLVVLLGSGVIAVGYVLAAGGLPEEGTVGSLVLAPLVLILYAVGTVGSAVVVSGASASLDGRPADLGAAWAKAMRHLPDLVALGAVFAVQRMVTGLLRNNRLGAILANVLDRLWDFATYLAVPVVLFEDAGPIRAIRRSGELVASRWGSQLTAQGVIGVFLFVCSLPAYLLAFATAVYVSVPLGVVLAGLTVLAVITLSSALSGVLSAAMYRFATTGLVAPGFTEADLRLVLSRRD